MKFAHITDLHLDFSNDNFGFKLIDYLNNLNVDAVLCTGDISNCKNLDRHLKLFNNLNCKFYFCPGNHSAYNGSLNQIYNTILKNQSEKITCVDVSEPVAFGDYAITGHMGWWDARYAKPLSNIVFWPDWLMIKDFRTLTSNNKRLDLAQDLSLQFSNIAIKKLEAALKISNKIIFLTHFSPWKEVCPSHGTWLENFWLPFNCSKYMGEALNSVMQDNPQANLIVLQGHSHVARQYSPRSNIQVRAAGAILDGLDRAEVLYL